MEITINNDNDEAAADETQPPSANNSNNNDEENPQGLSSTISMNGHYGSKASALHILSLLLNTALMIYAHLSPLGEVYSSQNPELTSSMVLPTSKKRALTSSLLQSRVTQEAEEDSSEAAATTTTTATTATGKCNNEDDLQNWVFTQGNTQRPVMSNYCSREWLSDDGAAAAAPCFLNATCIELCFVQVYNYTAECASCFSVVPECSVAAGCITSCALDTFGEECVKCNEESNCDEEFMACSGLPSSTTTSTNITSSSCNESDEQIWINTPSSTNNNDNMKNDPVAKVTTMFEICINSNDITCLLDPTCVETCLLDEYGYSTDCATCFGESVTCGVDKGCTLPCLQNITGLECMQCIEPCVDVLATCAGLSGMDGATSTAGTKTPSSGSTTDSEFVIQVCNNYDLTAIDEWYTVYTVRFIQSIIDAWDGEARLLAVIIVCFSGLWPYIKSLIILILWFIPIKSGSTKHATTLLWLARLSKYTLVDVFALIAVFVGVQLQLNIGGTEAVTRAEPRLGLIAFFFATVWQYIQIEIVKSLHDRRTMAATTAGNDTTDESKILFTKLWIPLLLLMVSMGLFVAGATTEVVSFTSKDTSGSCIRSYNLVTFIQSLLSDINLSSEVAQTHTLYVSYIILIFVFPILTHLLQVDFIFHLKKSNKSISKVIRQINDVTLLIWYFVSIEPLLIGIFAVEFKFPSLIMKLAGETNASFLDIDSSLGVGFYLLIAYSLLAGFLQFSLRLRYDVSTKQNNDNVVFGEKET